MTSKLHHERHHIAHHGERRVRIHVPSVYDGTRPFPLLVMFDGQNVFDDHGSYAGGWHADRAVDRLGRKRSRPIVLGIDHDGAGRIDELAPWGRMGGAGRADSFIGWISAHLVPEVRRRYAVVDGPAGVLVGGSSLGGLAALYAHFRHPETFGGALAMSPSLWLGKGKIFDFIGSQSTPWTSQIYLDCGEHEGRGAAATLTRRLEELLRARGYGADKLRFRVDRKGTHSERSWRRRLPAALRFFYR